MVVSRLGRSAGGEQRNPQLQTPAKWKRLPNNPRVRIAPCNSAGVVPPGTVPPTGTARLLNRPETTKA
jgi:hypothetical protein